MPDRPQWRFFRSAIAFAADSPPAQQQQTPAQLSWQSCNPLQSVFGKEFLRIRCPLQPFFFGGGW
ncbi:hypothetical protein QUA43_15275 [Microcoleus sp. N9_B4]|uniref:hypothetical protein n=1 Tax=Microcoleus sp. N9_B4 TaxID=3055386 RepID=UPI002FD54EDD